MRVDFGKFLISMGKKCKLFSQGTIAQKIAAYSLAVAIFIFLVIKKPEGVEFEYGKDRDPDSEKCHPYFDILIAVWQEERFGIARPRVPIAIFEIFKEMAKVVKLPEKSEEPKQPYQNFENELSDFDMSEATELVLSSDVPDWLWQTEEEIEEFGTIQEFKAALKEAS